MSRSATNKGEWGKWKLQQGRAKLCEDEDVNKTVMLLHTPNQDITVIVGHSEGYMCIHGS